MIRFTLAFALLLAGFALRHWLHGEISALIVGTLALSAFFAWDTWRASQLTAWLKADELTSPQQKGYWGELQYRFFQRLRGVQQQAQRERDRLDHFLDAIQASPNGVALLDAEDKIEWCNAQLAEHLGVDQERDRGQRIVFVVRHPEFVAYLAEGNFENALTISMPDLRRVEVQCFTISAQTGESSSQSDKLLLTRDVTVQERTEIMRRDFVANVSHELKTPLTVLKGFLETVHALDLTAEERERYLGMMMTQTDRMHNLVNDLLVLAKLEADNKPPESTHLSMTVMMDSLKSQAQALSKGRHKIEMQAEPTLDLIGNQTELMSAFSNLVSNAVRYTPTAGSIALSWKRNEDGASFSVTDTGIGIASQHISRITERFYRVDKGRAKLDEQGQELQGGTGLGLAIVKHALQRHGAELHIESIEGKGSRFEARFPSSRIVTSQELDVRKDQTRAEVA